MKLGLRLHSPLLAHCAHLSCTQHAAVRATEAHGATAWSQHGVLNAALHCG